MLFLVLITIKFWNLDTHAIDLDLRKHSNWVNCLLQPKQSKNILISGSSDKSIKIFNLQENTAEEKKMIEVESSVEQLCDLGNEIFAANSGDSIKIFSLDNFSEVQNIEGAHSSIIGLSLFGNFICERITVKTYFLLFLYQILII